MLSDMCEKELMKTDIDAGRIIVHIGLPKTATTTLQMDVFPMLKNENVDYVGVYQPRVSGHQDSFFFRFVKALSDGKIESVRHELVELLSSGKTIILSEEMITVSSDHVSWRTKLLNLSRILNDINYILIVTVREPASAMFSYYVEMIKHLSMQKINFLEFAKNDERMEIFHYGILANELIVRFEKDRIHIVKFEDIIQGNFEAILSGIGDVSVSEIPPLPKRNERTSSKDYVYTGRKSSIADFLKFFIRTSGLNRIRVVMDFLRRFKNILQYLDRVGIVKQRVQRPTAEQLEEIRSYVAKDNMIFEKEFGVKY